MIAINFQSRSIVLGTLALLVPSAAAQVVFEPPAHTPTSSGVGGDIAGGDLDADGHQDVILVHVEGLAAHLGDGAGHFGPALPIATPQRLYPSQPPFADMDGDLLPDLKLGSALVCADLTGDAFPDLVHAVPFLTEPLILLVGQGTGSFAQGAAYATGFSTGSVALDVGDADTDGDLDLLLTDLPMLALPTLTLLRNDGSGGLSLESLSLAHQTLLVNALFVEANGDGLLDVLANVFFDPTTNSCGTEVQLSSPGGFAFASVMVGTLVVDSGPLDGDSLADLLSWDSSGAATYLSLGDGTFVMGGVLPLPAPGPHGLADFDGDGPLDVLVHDFLGSQSAVHRGAGDGTVAAVGTPYTWTTSAFGALPPLVRDVDADGRVDLLTGAVAQGVANISAALNATYPAGSPLLDLGHALAGGQGWPIQIGEGSFVAGQPVAFHLSGAPASGLVIEVLGLSLDLEPFKGGVMVPYPGFLVGPFVASPAGSLELAGTWPSGVPSAFQVWLQAWFPDPAGPKGFAATTGVRITAP